MADLILTAAAIAGIAALASLRPRTCLYILLAILPTQFLFVPVSTFFISPADVMVVGSGLAFAIRLLRRRPDAIRSARQHVWAGAMILGYVLGGLLSGHFSRTVVRIGLSVVPSVLIGELVRERTHFARASTALVISAALDAGFAFWLYANGVPLYPDRFSGVAGPNFSAIFLTVGATIALTRLAQSPPARVLALPGALGALALATLSKMAALGLAVGGLMALPLVTRRNRVVLAAAAAILVAGALSTGTVRDRIRARFEPAMQNDGIRRTSTELRWSMMEAAMRGFAEHPLTGLGYGRFQQYSLTHPEILGATAGRGFGTHNTYLEVLVEGGLLAFVPFVLHFGFLRRALALYRAAVSSGDTVGAAAVAGLPAMLLCAALINMLLHYSLWAVIGIALAASRTQSAADAAVQPAAPPRQVAS